MKTKIEIIQEVGAYYNLNNRAINEKEGCVYSTPDNKRCAVGRYIKEEYISKVNNWEKCIVMLLCNTLAVDLFKEFGFDILKDDYKIEDLDFWINLQEFHDNGCNWTNEGLSEQGKVMMNDLIDKYK